MTANSEVLCGVASWRPAFLQPLASKKIYMLIYGSLGIIQGMFFTYLSATLSTLERQFGIKSKEAAYIMSGNEFSQILFVFVMPFIVKVKKRPFWTAMGLFCSALGCFMMAIPHWIRPQQKVMSFGLSNDTDAVMPLTSSDPLCSADLNAMSSGSLCDEDGNRRIDWAGLVIIFIAILLTGVGNCAFHSFGVAYLDDNTSHKNSPVMLALTFTFRLLGPTLGFLLGSFCLKTYVYPSQVVQMEEGDPDWIGAWWLGYPIIGSLIAIFAGPLILFPERLPKAHTDANKRKLLEEEMHSMINGKPSETTADAKKADFKEAMKRLLTNKVFMFNFGSSLFFVFAFMGFGTFMPKYMEYQYRMKGSTSSVTTGGIGTASKAIGMLLSGFAISKWKFSARILSGWNVVLGCLYFVSLIVFSNLGCPSSSLPIMETGACNADCACSANSRIVPICAKDGLTNYYSPCFAGCQTSSFDKNTKTKYYSGCSCIADQWIERNMTLSVEWVKKGPLKSWDYPSLATIEEMRQKTRSIPNDEAVGGWCPVDCGNVFRTFGIVFFILIILGSTGRIGNVLVALRCIDVRDKSLSMAFNVVFLSLLAMLPSPMIYGAIIDQTCTLWQMDCGEQANCLLYDLDKMRKYMMLTTAAIMSIGVIFDVFVWYHCKDVELFSASSEEEDKDGATKSES